MENIAEHLKNIKVLDNNDIIMFKNHICKKYPENTTAKNAMILSDAIHKVICRNLEGLPEDFKLIIKTATLENTLGSGKSLITLYDIFNSCLIDETLKSNFKEQLANWVTLHIKAKIQVEELDLYLKDGDIKIKKTVKLEENMYVENKEKIIDSDIIKEDQDSRRVKTIKSKLLIYLNHFNFNRRIALIIMCMLIIPLYVVSKNFNFNINKDKTQEENYIIEADKSTSNSSKYPNSHLPEYMRYKSVNQEKLKSFLYKHNSFLSKEPYFSTMLSVSKEFNLNPIVLFSITGQEQSFVPKDKYNASKIANNPFNVYHSWKEYNTNIRDSSSIAARTVINLSQNMPENEDPFLWIGKKYAEDKYWGNGVKSIFKELSSCVN
jgi:hypothetical protein